MPTDVPPPGIDPAADCPGLMSPQDQPAAPGVIEEAGAGSHAAPEPMRWDGVLGGILIAFVVLDVVLVFAKKLTISQRLRNADRRRPWVKWLTAGAMLLGWLHFFRGWLWNALGFTPRPTGGDKQP